MAIRRSRVSLTTVVVIRIIIRIGYATGGNVGSEQHNDNDMNEVHFFLFDTEGLFLNEKL